MKRHREIDLQRHMVDGQLLYRSLCQCGFLSRPGSRAQAQQEMKAHTKHGAVE